ncbi:MAG: bifunctional metallophosphatase/5'-nucleotidase [Bacteroidales bacterium]|nr:bifunctional metallophosphatase/5'-nucleotidase [Bacteroidales bacterium]
MNKTRYFLLAALSLVLFSCEKEEIPGSDKSIVILCENDVHCSIDGYTRLAGLRDAIAASDTAWTATVSCGDYVQGGNAGALSRGQYIVDVMKAVGYDAVTLGNHEFDYGAERMQELMPQIGAPVVCANLFKYGSSTSFFPSYTILEYGSRRVAFVGVTTPETMIGESYSFYDNEGNQLYDLRTDDVCNLVQTSVNEARSRGADYVVVLSHLGEEQPALGITSHQLVAATRGIDVVLDGHSHSVVQRDDVPNLDGKLVPVTQTGTQFANVGKLVITADGHIFTTLIPCDDISYENASVSSVVTKVHQDLDQVTGRKIASSEFDFLFKDADGRRLLRLGETNLGDLLTDAVRYAMQAQIGLFNGGGFRSGIPAGSITYGDVTNAQPYDDHLAKFEVSGAEILSMLERCTAALPAEEGQFPQVSGLRYTIHQQSDTVSDVAVQDEGTGDWIPIDPAGRYTIASSDYYARGGFYDTLKDGKQLAFSAGLVRDALADYLEKTLGGIVPDIYAQPQGRITIVND